VQFATEFHWDRSAYANCLTSFLLATGFGTVALGSAIARWGVRRPSIGFIAAFAACVAVVGLLPASLPLFYVLFALIGIFGAAATAMPYAVAVSGFFDRHRGLALGTVNTGAGVGAAIAPHFARYLMNHYDWRTGFFAVALVVAAVALPSLTFLVSDPPGVRRPIAGNEGVARRRLENQFLRDPRFWLIAFLILALSIATFGVMGSLVPFLKDHAITGDTVANVLSTAGVASWVGRLLTGYLLDRLFAPYLAAFVVALALLGLALLYGGQVGLPILAGAALVGATLGAEGDLVAFLVGRYFSLASFSRVIGTMWVMWAWGGGLGSFMASVSFKLSHSYNLAFGLFAIFLLASGVLALGLGPYRYPRMPAVLGAVPEEPVRPIRAGDLADDRRP
jgi:predicted MFS family arabinose efflux permease